MRLYINGYCTVSPQESLLDEPKFVLSHLVPCVEPDYSETFNSGEARRMSKIVKCSVAAGLQALKLAEVNSPNAIITSTAYGCMQDTQKFLDNMDKNEEEFLTPTSFIQSTHNTIGGLIAIKLTCNAPNYTFVHNTHALENALLETEISIQDKENYLIGGFDHMPEKFATVYDQLNYWKKEDNKSLLSGETSGFYNGYGTSFFVLSSDKKEQSKACLESLDIYNSSDLESIKTKLDADFILYGINGDKESNSFYNRIRNQDTPAGYYKHLCGEYPTSTGIGIAVAMEILVQQRIPQHLMWKGEAPSKIESICLVESDEKGKTSILKLTDCLR